MDWFYLALLAPVLYAIVNLLDDNLLQFVYQSPYVAVVSAGFYGTLPLLSRLFIHTHNIPTSLALLSVLAGALTLGTYFFYFKGLAADTPGVVVALFSLAPATIPFLAHFILHEHLNGMEILGLAIVLVASLGLAISDFKKFAVSKAVWPVLAAIVLLDAVAIITKHVYQQVDFYPAYLYFSVGMGLGGLGFFGMRYHDNKKAIATISKSIKKLWPIFVVAELVGLSAELTLNLAVSRGPVSLVEVIQGVQPMFMLLIALSLYPLSPRYFREAEAGHPIRKFGLMALGVIGLAVISFAA